jgi:hypothetical protein
VNVYCVSLVTQKRKKGKKEGRHLKKLFQDRERKREREKGYFVFVGTLSLQLSFVSFFTISFKRLGPF